MVAVSESYLQFDTIVVCISYTNLLIVFRSSEYIVDGFCECTGLCLRENESQNCIGSEREHTIVTGMVSIVNYSYLC